MAAYIDGFNFYHGLMAKGWGRFRWLDYRALMERFTLPEQELVAVKYFTSRVIHEPTSLARQEVYLRALEKRGGVEVITGEYQTRKVQCPKCDRWYKRRQEKKTDVNLATHLVADAYEDHYDCFFLLTADADLVPAAEFVIERHHKPMVLIDPPRRHSDELASLSSSHLHITSSWLSASQLPDPLEWQPRPGRTRQIYRPEEWV